MTGATVGQAEAGKDLRDASGGRQWTDLHGFHFLEYGIGPVRAAPVIEVEPHQCDDFFDFNLAERCAVHLLLLTFPIPEGIGYFYPHPPGLISMNRSSE